MTTLYKRLYKLNSDGVSKQVWEIHKSPDDKEYWLEARPRWQQDAANFNRVELILDRQRFLPSALQIHLPNGKNRTAYRFQLNRAKVNDPVQRFFTSFQQPITPLGWKKVVEKVPTAGPGRQARQPQEDGPDTRR